MAIWGKLVQQFRSGIAMCLPLEPLFGFVKKLCSWHSLETHKHAKNYESVSIFKLASTDQEVFDMQVSGIKERYLGRYGVNVGEVDILVFCKTLTGRKYTCTSKGRITLDKQWAELSVPFALQSIVKDITEKSPDFEEFKTVEELFPVGKTCFMIGNPHYGCSGTNLCQVHYMNAHQMSQQLGVNAQFVSRITGTVYIQMNSREAESASLVNVGLHLKFNKTSEEIPGYSKRTNDTWLYSTKCLQVLKEYLAK
ncbi:hypothetical protein HPB52_025645 [Rhipicephalus sanguineus]|uniref:Exoribonuclease Xrn1 D2/D3 domain-containing protein n=1 Tax=Rhipicephalus sanguineus TaxID=34632 RepID=A0A9D4SM52_RHISA|nr:hypothetical protein HPB52_025645 [Rhipicephalus sanguineus]